MPIEIKYPFPLHFPGGDNINNCITSMMLTKTNITIEWCRLLEDVCG